MEDKVYINAMVPLILTIGGDLTNSKEQKVYYIKPSGASGYWDAAVWGDPTTGKVIYNTTKTDFDEAGLWKFQGWEKDEFDRENHGETFELQIYNLGE